MELIVVLVIAIAVLVVWGLMRQRSRAKTEAGTDPVDGLTARGDVFGGEAGSRAPIADFHVKGDQALVHFDVPLPDADDEVLNDLLVGEAVEVVREKRHSLPLEEITEIVALAGKQEAREVGRTRLPSRGELPPPMSPEGINFSHIARDPFAVSFDQDSAVPSIETRSDVPADELGPIRDELRIPAGLERGLRASGMDPDQMSAQELVLGLLRMFGYSVTEHSVPGSYMAVKGGLSTFIATDPYQPGDYPELEESVIRRFVTEFNSSGADRGILLSGKYSPFLIHDIERNQPKVRFVTRERVQGFIDSMALG